MSELLAVAERATADFLSGLKDEVGDSIESAQVRSVALIGLALAEQIGDEAFEVIDAILDGKPFDDDVLTENLSLLEISDLLDVAQSLEARQKVAVQRMLAATKSASIKIASTMIRAAIALV